MVGLRSVFAQIHHHSFWPCECSLLLIPSIEFHQGDQHARQAASRFLPRSDELSELDGLCLCSSAGDDSDRKES